MIINIYQELQRCKNAVEVEETLARINRTELFEPIINSFDNWYPVVMFIIYAYSWDSEYLALDEDWEETIRTIADEVGIEKDDNFDDIVFLKKESLGLCVDEYLTIQGNSEFKHLTTLKNLYIQLMSSINLSSTDMDQKVKNAGHAKKLREDIEEYEGVMRKKLGAKFLDLKEKTKKIVEARKKPVVAQGTLSLENNGNLR